MFAKRIQHVSHRCASFLALHRSCASQRVPKVWFRHAPSVVSPVIAPDPFISHAGDARFLPTSAATKFSPPPFYYSISRAFDERGGGVLKTTTKTKTKTKRTKTEESRRRPPPPPPPPRIVSPFLFHNSFSVCEERISFFQRERNNERESRRERESLSFFCPFFVRCFVLFPFFQLLLFSLFFSFFLSSFVCVFFTYKKTSLSLSVVLRHTLKEEEEEREERRWRPRRRRATLRRTRRRLPREVRARRHFFEGGGCIFRFFFAFTHYARRKSRVYE